MNEDIGDFAVKAVLLTGYVNADMFHNNVDFKKRDKRVIGLVLKTLVHRGFIKPMGYIRSQRKECHYRPIINFVKA